MTIAHSHHTTASIGCKLLVAFIATMVSVGAKAENHDGNQPKLVVGIVVDDFQPEYIDLLKEQLTLGGFNRLLDQGVVIANTDYGTALDPASATAVIFTGASPAVNGIPSAEIFDRSTLHGVSVFNDPSIMGNFTSQTLSPSSLTVNTIADELRVAGGGINNVYSISPDPEQAIIMTGHAGNCGIWLNDANISWATTTYYKDAPSTLNSRNRIESLHTRIDSITWSPMHPREWYSLLPDHVTVYPFKYTFRQTGPQKMQAFRTSPKINEEVTNFAIDNLQTLKLGHHSVPDMLNINYTLAPYAFTRNSDNRYELVDAYYRLDQNLNQLFNAIDKNVGLNNTLIFLAATPVSQRVRRDDERWQLPYGEYSTRKAISLLNLYLIAKYGNGEWVQAYHNNQFFLNHKLIDESGLELEAIQSDAARFLEKMSGVRKAYGHEEILKGVTPEAAQLRQNTTIKYAGDIWLEVMPGWQIIDDYNSRTRTEKVERAVSPTAPTMILAPGVAARKIDTPVDARAIAPTVTRLLRIRSPNAAGVSPLILE